MHFCIPASRCSNRFDDGNTMVAYNITLDDTSPLITYTGTWIRKHPEGTLVYPANEKGREY
jgi:hypothetical protein